MELFFRKSGAGDPVIILHGLYGSSDNWHSIGRELATEHTVYLIDQRNHGASPHHPEHNYPALRDDLYEFMQKHGISKPIILGHSMGGKTALAFGLKYPEKVAKMIVVDISPLGYASHQNSPGSNIHERIISTLQTIRPDLLTSREEADRLLQKTIAPLAIRQFLLKNLKRSAEGKFFWSLNVDALAENMPAIFSGILPESTDEIPIPRFPLLFIRGEFSTYIRSKDEEAIHQYFPWAGITMIPGAGHWVHAEQPEAFLKNIRNFIQEDN